MDNMMENNPAQAEASRAEKPPTRKWRAGKVLAVVTGAVALVVGSLAVSTLSPFGAAGAQDNDPAEPEAQPELISEETGTDDESVEADDSGKSEADDKATEADENCDDGHHRFAGKPRGFGRRGHGLMDRGDLEDKIAEWSESLEEKMAEMPQAWSERLEEKMAERQERRVEREAKRAERLATLADALGVDSDALVEALRNGQTVAELAGDNADEVIAVLVAGAAEEIQAKVADGTIEQDKADAMIATLEERITAMVTGEHDGRGHGFKHFGKRGRGLHGHKFSLDKDDYRETATSGVAA